MRYITISRQLILGVPLRIHLIIHTLLRSASLTSLTPQSGDVFLFSARPLTVSNVIRTYKSPLASLALNSTGTLLATSSEMGTVIRVWSVPGAKKLY
jgi:autophagy-related protein 18